MSHLLMIESWVSGTGRLFPTAILQQGHRYTFVTRKRAHYLGAPGSPIHPVLEHAEHVLTAETNDLAALIEFLRAQHAILKFDGVVTICDYYVGTVAEVAQALGLPQAFSANVVLERRKDLVRAALQAAGLPNPRFAVCADWAQARAAAQRIGYPLVAKPTDLASSAFVRLVHNDDELQQAQAELDAFTHNFRDQPRVPLLLLEERMQGAEVSVEACTYAGETTILGITDKSLAGEPYFIETGHMFPAQLDETSEQAVHALVHAALVAVGHDHGISHTEVMLTPDGPRIVEINPRPGGNYIAELVALVSGIDLLRAQIDLALGRKPNLTAHATGIASAAIQFLLPERAGRIAALHGRDSLADDTYLTRWSVADPAGSEVTAPIDNACYLGHVVAIDLVGGNARAYAARALSRLRLEYVDAGSLLA